MGHGERFGSPAVAHGGEEANPALTDNLTKKVTGLKAKVAELANSVAGPWGEEEVDVAMLDSAASKDNTEASKCVMLLDDVKNMFMAEIKSMEQDFKLQVNMQKSENLRFKQLLADVKSEKTSIHQQLLFFQRRVEKLETEIGQD